MENSKKPSTIFLVKDHHSFEGKTILFKDEMLDWPFFWDNFPRITDEDIVLQESLVIIYRNVLEGILKLEEFSMKLSLWADEKRSIMIIPKRVHGHLFLGETKVISFTHHTKRQNSVLTSIVDWVEMESIAPDEKYTTEEQFRSDWDRITAVLVKWPPGQWRDFFQKRISDKAEKMKKKAEKKREDATNLDTAAQTLLDAIAAPSSKARIGGGGVMG